MKYFIFWAGLVGATACHSLDLQHQDKLASGAGLGIAASEAPDHIDPSHNLGVIIRPETNLVLGPDTGAGREGISNTWTIDVDSTPEDGTKLLLLHFTDINLPGENIIEVELGYGTDTIRASDGAEFWTRPINIYPLQGLPVVVRYITDGKNNAGKATIDKIGVGKRSPGDDGQPPAPATDKHVSLSNCDPFLQDEEYEKPEFDGFWFCGGDPRWEPSTCVASDNPNDIRVSAARSVGMILGPHGETLSSCTVTLIEPDKILTAGHCVTGPDAAQASSVIFNYETDCNGKRLPGYSPRFYKVEKVLESIWEGGKCRRRPDRDYARLKLKEVPVGVQPLQLRSDFPAVGEEVFGIHHPNGAPKVLSLPHKDGFTKVIFNDDFIRVGDDFHISGGSSGSPLLDKAGRVLGVLSYGEPCKDDPLRFFPSATFLKLVDSASPPSRARDVMIVLDRSGSMKELDSTGRSKMDVARDAASLFVQLVRKDLPNRLGLVSFHSVATVDAALANVNDDTKRALIGDAPFAKGRVGDLVEEGSTSIGDGLDKARLQLPPGGSNTNPRAILLMTDGMQNTPPFISDIEGNLGGIEVWSIGFGKDSNLDSKLLDQLSSDKCGMFTRASTGVSLQKFFSVAFGNIFEGGVLQDPEYYLLAGQGQSEPVPFHVCSEDAITISVGWDDIAEDLGITLTTPGGVPITESSPGVEASSGRTWTFLRVPIPYRGEQDGQWNVTVYRQTHPSRRYSPVKRQGTPPIQYFINIIPTGGPRMSLGMERRRYYTGDIINPLIFFRYPDGSWPFHAKVMGTITRPNASIGAALSASGLHQPATGVDVLPAIQKTLGDIGFSAGSEEVTFELSSESADTGGLFEESGVWGKVLNNSLVVEGDYQFHFRGTTQGDCSSNREVLWSVHVDVGIDPAKTDVKTHFTGTTSDGKSVGIITITPRDKFSNPVGPGRGEMISVTPGPGTTIIGSVIDNGNGEYIVSIRWDPASGFPPTILITQPDRLPVVIQEPGKCTIPTGTVGTCQICDPAPGKNKCHPTTACSNTPFGNMCVCRPGYRADKDLQNAKFQWRLNWPIAGHEHRVYVEPGLECDTLCDEWFLGVASCKEVFAGEC